MKNLIYTLIFIIIASVAFSQKKTKCILDLKDDYAYVVGPEVIDILVFKNDIGNFDPAKAKILGPWEDYGPFHGQAAPDTDCFTYSMDHIYCDPDPDKHFFNNLDTFEYYVQLVCDDYCNPGDGKIWTIEAEYIGPDGADVEVITKKGIDVGNASGLNKGDYFTIDGSHLPINQTDWDYTFTFTDNSTETVRVHTSCSQLIFGENFANLLIPRSGCIATYDEKDACDLTPLQRDKVKTREDHIFPKIVSDTAMVIIENQEILPIHILDFSLTSLRNENHLSWSITNVVNEEYMALEKSYDGVEFFELTRFEELYNGEYIYIDYLNDRSVKMHYYRLAIMDYDGDLSYSNIIIGRVRTEYNSPVLVYPNPSSGMVTVELLDDGVDLRSIALDDISGKRIMFVPLDHNSSITFSLRDRTDLKGVYLLGVELSNGEVVHKRILLTQE